MVLKSRMMIQAGHVARVGKMRNAYKTLVANLEGREHSEDLGVYGKIILKWILGKWCGKLWTGCIWLRIGTTGGLL
jgi:hypothetical protein